MPKTENSDEESNEEVKEDEDEEKTPEEVDLNLGDLEFHQFMQPSETTSSPVLEKIASHQERPIFVGGIPQGSQTIPGEEEKSDEFKYVASSQQDGEPKYLSSDSQASVETNKVNLTEVGRGQPGISSEMNQQAFFEQFSERRDHNSPMVEKKWSTERFDTEKVGSRDFIKKEERKYRPDFPKSG